MTFSSHLFQSPIQSPTNYIRLGGVCSNPPDIRLGGVCRRKALIDLFLFGGMQCHTKQKWIIDYWAITRYTVSITSYVGVDLTHAEAHGIPSAITDYDVMFQ